MGFDDIKHKVIEAILNGFVDHEDRKDFEKKNMYAMDQITDAEIIFVIKTSKGHDYCCEPHETKHGINVHIIKRKGGRYDGLYIKFYFVEPGVWFISAHY